MKICFKWERASHKIHHLKPFWFEVETFCFEIETQWTTSPEACYAQSLVLSGKQLVFSGRSVLNCSLRGIKKWMASESWKERPAPSPGPVVKRSPLRTLLFEECYNILRIEDVGIFWTLNRWLVFFCGTSLLPLLLKALDLDAFAKSSVILSKKLTEAGNFTRLDKGNLSKLQWWNWMSHWDVNHKEKMLISIWSFYHPEMIDNFWTLDLYWKQDCH